MAEKGFRVIQRAKLSSQDTQMNTISISCIFLPKIKLDILKKKNTKNGFQNRLSLNAGPTHRRMLPLEHSAKLSTCIKLPLVIKIVFLSFFELPLKTDFPVSKIPLLEAPSCTHMRICVCVGTSLLPFCIAMLVEKRVFII